MEQALARIAGRQHGVVTRAELLRAGITSNEIEHRLKVGLLIREHRGVYRVGHRAPSVEARYLAAVRACGEGALLSGRAASHLLCVLLVNLASFLDVDDLARACHEAGVRYRTTLAEVESVLARQPNSPGATELRSVLRGDVRVTLSKLELRFLELLRESGLASPETNRPAGGRRVDCRWPDLRLTVELDSYRYHHSRHAWEQDRRREREARARGDDFRRYTYADIFEHPSLMLRELHALLPSAA